MDFKFIMEHIISPAMIVAIQAIVLFLLKRGLDLVSSEVKKSLHFRGSGVVIDSIFEAAHDLGIEIEKALKDGKLTKAEKDAIKNLAKKLAKDKLIRLSGFAKKELDKWVDEQLKIALTKLLARMF